MSKQSAHESGNSYMAHCGRFLHGSGWLFFAVCCKKVGALQMVILQRVLVLRLSRPCYSPLSAILMLVQNEPLGGTCLLPQLLQEQIC